MGGRPRSITGVEAVASILPLDVVHVHGALDGDPVALLIVGKVVDDMVRRWEPLVGWHGLARQAGKLRGGKQRHRWPHMPPRPTGILLIIEDQGVHACSQQVVGGGQARLATANNDRLEVFAGHVCDRLLLVGGGSVHLQHGAQLREQLWAHLMGHRPADPDFVQ